MADANWIKIKNEYINGDISYRKLAGKHDVNIDTLKKRALKEKWTDLREKCRIKIATKVHQKTAEKIAEQESDYIVNIKKYNFGLAKIIEKFLSQKDGYAILEAKDLKALTSALKDIKDIQNDNAVKNGETEKILSDVIEQAWSKKDGNP